MTVVTPETHSLPRNRFAPNSRLPILIYRDCLPLPITEASAKSFLESHAWLHGGTWGHIPRRHFHPNTHECYGIFQGESTMLVGCGHNDDEADGLKLEVRKGDVIVLPAGTGHCNLTSTPDYRYVGVYPEGAPKWRNELGKAEGPAIEALRKEAETVAMPKADPVNGADGPLLTLWANA